MLAFDSASVTDLLKEFSQTSASRIAIGYLLMVNIFKLFSVWLIFFFSGLCFICLARGGTEQFLISNQDHLFFQIARIIYVYWWRLLRFFLSQRMSLSPHNFLYLRHLAKRTYLLDTLYQLDNISTYSIMNTVTERGPLFTDHGNFVCNSRLTSLLCFTIHSWL